MGNVAALKVQRGIAREQLLAMVQHQAQVQGKSVAQYLRELQTQVERNGEGRRVPQPVPVRSKYSCGFTVVVLQQPTQPFLALDGPFTLPHMTRHRQEQRIALALMIPLVIIMQVVLGKSMPQGAFPKENLS